MNIHAPTLFEQSLKAKYADVSKRLMGTPLPKAVPQVIEVQQPVPFRPRKVADLPAPLCKMRKDAHVVAYREWQGETLGQPCKAHIMRRGRDFGYSHAEIVGLSRARRLIIARHTIMWEIKRYVKPEISYPELGRMFGGRDHTSCLHAVKKMDGLMGWKVAAA